MNNNEKKHRYILEEIAHRAMLERGLLPDFSVATLAELDKMGKPAAVHGERIRDLRKLQWASIDNDDSRDLDQLTVAEAMKDDKVKILVAVADVEALVKKGKAIDEHARHNTTSVYTAAKVFPMLPERLSTDLTSLNPDGDRLAVIVEMVIEPDGSPHNSDIYPAVVRNQAQLAYNGVAAWLEGDREPPEAIRAVRGLAENLRLQDETAQRMKHFRQLHGALSLETIEAKPTFAGDQIAALEVEVKNRAREIVEDFMIAANGVAARYLEARKYPSLRRVVRTPKRWERIVEVANEHGFRLPNTPDSKALEEFLNKERTADPLRFPDLSLVVIKLMGAGEYVADAPGKESPGHFGLAVKDYTHSTAPNRRYPDLITQRLLKAAFEGHPVPYRMDELEALAKHCTEAEDAANKVERQVGKSAAALLLESRIGERFEAIVTGASPKGTWARLLSIPIEGKVVQGYENMDVGHRVQVQLIFVDVERGFIDFKKVGHGKKR
jgi:VacB/RNase II family 3'-5' exoribonuclease